MSTVDGIFVTNSTSVRLNQPPTEHGVCGSLDGTESLASNPPYLRREHYGIVGLVANRTKQSSSHPSGLFYLEEDVHKGWERNFAELSSVRGRIKTFSRDKILTNSV